jgi:hypothetical protein
MAGSRSPSEELGWFANGVEEQVIFECIVVAAFGQG